MTRNRVSQPPETPTGTCVHCGGLVKGEYKHGLRLGVDMNSVPLGPGSRAYFGWNFQGYHCEKCGLVYKFPPPADVSKKEV